MPSPVLLDFESRSPADLDYGGRNYWAHPSTEALCCAWYDPQSQDVGVWFPGQQWPHHGRTLGAHNMTGFDRFGAIRYGFISAADEWIDTSELARCAGLPGALDALGSRWVGLAKDKDASRFTKGLSRPKRPKTIPLKDWRGLSPEEQWRRGVPVSKDDLNRVTSYCLSDVEIMIHGWPLLESWTALEPDVVRVDRAVNDRGVYLDQDLCRALLLCDEINAETVVEESARVLGWTASRTRDCAMSPKQFCEATRLSDATKDTIDLVLADKTWEYDDRVVALCEARRALASIARGKLEAGLARVSPDFRLRDTHRYYGGHTGRWSGKGMQLQNLPRPPVYYREWLPEKPVEKWSDDDLCRLAEAVKEGEHCATAEGINILLRACLCAAPGKTLAVCDFAGVEARCLAWAAGDDPALEVFAAYDAGTGPNPYSVAGAQILGVAVSDCGKGTTGYAIGKIAELACGYQMGANKLYSNYGDKLDAAGVNADEVVAGWRQQHAASKRLWYACQGAFLRAVAGQCTDVGPFRFTPSDDGADVMLWLPSGRPIVYPEARVDSEGNPKYLSSKSWEHLYGGKIVENAIQATCRDLLARALVLAEAAGLNPVMHVHDEIICEVDERAGQEGYRTLRSDCMLTLPDWAEGFPIGAAGFVGKRYRK